MSSSDDENIRRLRQGLNQQSEWRTKAEETATNSLADFLMGLIRPFVKDIARAAVTTFGSLLDWLRGLFTK